MRYAETGYNLEIDLSRGNIARPAILKMSGKTKFEKTVIKAVSEDTFVQDIITKTLKGMLSSLKGVDSIKSFQISLIEKS